MPQGSSPLLAICVISLLAAGGQPALQTDSFELAETTIEELQQGMTSGRYTSRRLTELYLQRIEQLDRGGPQLRSISEVNPDAAAIASSLDAERKSKGPRRLRRRAPPRCRSGHHRQDQPQ